MFLFGRLRVPAEATYEGLGLMSWIRRDDLNRSNPFINYVFPQEDISILGGYSKDMCIIALLSPLQCRYSQSKANIHLGQFVSQISVDICVPI